MRRRLIIFFVIVIFILGGSACLTGCGGNGILIPYYAEVIKVEPDIDGLKIVATQGGGGELEIRNLSESEVELFLEDGNAFVRINADGPDEYMGRILPVRIQSASVEGATGDIVFS